MATAAQIKAATAALTEACDAIVEAVNAVPAGIPAGHLYALSMGLFTLSQFEIVMTALVKQGRISKQGLLYLPAK